MFVIVEGIDRVGKSTLCDKLASNGFIKLKDVFGVVHSSFGFDTPFYYPNSGGFPTYSIGKLDTAVQYIKQLNDLGYNIVADRLHLTELVYGILDRPAKASDINVHRLDMMIDQLFGNDAALILVTSDDIEKANLRAERDLSLHEDLFIKEFKRSHIRQKFLTDFYGLDNMVELIAKTAFKYDFYFASPFFRPDQVEREERLKAHLRALGFKVFSPKEACHLEATANTDRQNDVFLDNVRAINQSVAVFAITDTKDMGTIWEAGYAYGIKKPIIYYAETLGNNQFNLMLARSGRAVFTCQDNLYREELDAILFKGKRMDYKGVIE